MTSYRITTISDLATYLDGAFELSAEDAKAAAECISARRDRPDYGDDWAAFLDALEPDAVHELLDDRHELIDLAAEHVGATRYAGETLFGYTDDDATPGAVYLVTAADMVDLGSRLRRGDKDAYSHWCGETSVESTTAEQVLRAAPELYTNGLAGLTETAGAAGDYLTCAAVDHLSDAIGRLISGGLVIVDADGGEVEVEDGDWYEAIQCDGTEDYDRGRVREVDVAGRRALIGWSGETSDWLTVEQMRGGLVYSSSSSEPDWAGSWPARDK